MRIEKDADSFTYHIYGEHADNYEGTARVIPYGDRAFLKSLQGKNVYNSGALLPLLNQIFEDLALSVLYAYVMPSHARLIRMYAPKGNFVISTEPGVCAGRPMVWLEIKHEETR